jgi:4-amino-4-deoxy-L-arabinose transferase-like glycosyltransferase
MVRGLAARLVALLDRGGQRFGTSLGLIALLAMLARLGLRAAHGTANYWSEGYGFFFDIAANLAAGDGYGLVAGQPSAFRVPGYPLFLVAVTQGEWKPWAIVLAQSVLGGLTVVAAGLIGRRRFGRRAGLLAALVCAAWPYYLWHDTALQETALYTCLTAWAVVLLLRLDSRGGLAPALGAGVLMTLAVLVREPMLPFALLASLWAGWRLARREGLRRGVLAALAMLTVLGAGLTPWLAYSRQVNGAAVLGTEFGGALYAANHPAVFSHYPDGSIDQSRVEAFKTLTPADWASYKAMTPLARDHWLRGRGAALVLGDLPGFALRGLRKIWIAFRPFPSPLHSAPVNWVYALTWLPVLVLGLAGLWRERREWRRDLPVHLLFATFIGITAVLWAQTAHRAFLDLYLIVFAAGYLVRRETKRRHVS